MKKLILSSLVALIGLSSFGQIIVNIESPASLAGNRDYTIAESSGGWTAMPDMTDPLNAVLDTLVVVDDGTADDSLGCNGLVNAAAVAGKIAVIWRGACQFGTKALNAQNAGAVGVIIVNNIPGAPVGMGPGTDGPSINIPTVMISDVDGALLKDSLDMGSVITAFIGSKSGYYGNDAGTTDADVLRAENAVTPRQLAQTAADFSVDMGARVYNYGANALTGVTLTATIEFGGSVIYNETSTGSAMNSGDTLFIALPTFSQPSYDVGYYTVTYSVFSDSTDEFIGDNIVNADFQISNDLLSLGQLDTAMQPESGVYFRAVNSGGNTDFTSCMHFRDADASRLAVNGMWWAASGGQGDSLTGTYMQLFVYEWIDVFTDLNDAAYDNVNLTLNEVASGEYDYLSDLQNEFVYAPVLDGVGGQLELLNNTRYLFCVSASIDNLFISHDSDADYTINRDYYLQPLHAIQADMTWNANGFGAEPMPSTAVSVTGVNTINEQERPEFVAYPNPAADLVTFRLGNDINLETVSITNIAGSLVKTRGLNNGGAGSIALDVSDLANGQYIFTFTETDGTVSNVKVTIAR